MAITALFSPFLGALITHTGSGNETDGYPQPKMSRSARVRIVRGAGPICCGSHDSNEKFFSDPSAMPTKVKAALPARD
jgi:hypothetical protein